MSQAPESRDVDPEITKTLAEYSTGISFDDLSAEAVEASKHCLLDWIGVTIAGLEEPLTQMLIEQAEADGGEKQASIVGDGRRFSTSQAALINGSASHALDYDDVQTRLQGHPTVPVAPVVLALGEKDGASGKDVITAFAAGVDAECRIGAYIGMTHYLRGWHSTATIGTFGAAVGASRMLCLDSEKCALALGIAGTQSAGLKSMFG
ncbi:MAG: MmgE/PrpD family protein, partial [Pseudomonadota bacterium]|nr:MmgE/PrpD family protein [Pseudomonadota bacterium]